MNMTTTLNLNKEDIQDIIAQHYGVLKRDVNILCYEETYGYHEEKRLNVRADIIVNRILSADINHEGYQGMSTKEEIGTAMFLLGLIRKVETPMLMYQHEKDVVKKALKKLIQDNEKGDS